MSRYVEIAGWGKYVPSTVLSNFDLEKMVDTSDEWIMARSGISERRLVGPGEATSDISIAAARAALERAGMQPADIDLIIVATATPDYPSLPATACIVQNALGATGSAAFDLSAACSGFVYGLVTATQFILTGTYRNALIIGAETLSRVINWTDRATCVLFGDGAGAVVIRATERKGGLISFTLGSDGSGARSLIIPAGGSRTPASQETVREQQHYLKMNGREVFKFASRILPRAFHEVLEKAGVGPDEVDLLIPHQANERIIRAARPGLCLDDSEIYSNVARYGNTSAASVPMALCEAIDEGRVNPGSLLAMVAFGAGLTWGAALWKWQ